MDDGVEGLLADSDVMLAGALAHLAGDPALRARIRGHNLDVPPRQDWPGVVAATLREYRRAGVRATVITVVGRNGGRVVASFALDHGDDPVEGLAARGWAGGPECRRRGARRPHPAVCRRAGGSAVRPTRTRTDPRARG